MNINLLVLLFYLYFFLMNLKNYFILTIKKIILKNISDIFKYYFFRDLAYWKMDVGSKQNKGLHINIYSFSVNDIELLLNTLK